nr:PREDICTED: glucoside xylosyltransferase 2-like [Struthio camelus australis]
MQRELRDGSPPAVLPSPPSACSAAPASLPSTAGSPGPVPGQWPGMGNEGPTGPRDAGLEASDAGLKLAGCVQSSAQRHGDPRTQGTVGSLVPSGPSGWLCLPN